jgi:hypothetical protein
MRDTSVVGFTPRSSAAPLLPLIFRPVFCIIVTNFVKHFTAILSLLNIPGGTVITLGKTKTKAPELDRLIYPLYRCTNCRDSRGVKGNSS